MKNVKRDPWELTRKTLGESTKQGKALQELSRPPVSEQKKGRRLELDDLRVFRSEIAETPSKERKQKGNRNFSVKRKKV